MRMEVSSEGEAVDHYRHALQYYQKALIGLWRISDLRTALVACLLAFSFESFNDRPDLAVAHIRSGFKLLEQWLRSQPQGPKPLSSPAQNLIEDDLLCIFVRMDIHVLTMADAELKVLAQVTKSDPPTEETLPMAVPTVFSSIGRSPLLLRNPHLQNPRPRAQSPKTTIQLPGNNPRHRHSNALHPRHLGRSPPHRSPQPLLRAI